MFKYGYIKSIAFFAVLTLCGCPVPNDTNNGDDSAEQPAPPVVDDDTVDMGDAPESPDGSDEDGASPDAQSVADGTFSGTAKRVVTLFTPEDTVEATSEDDVFVIIEVEDQHIRTVRFGFGTEGVFDRWALDEGEGLNVVQAVGPLSTDVNRTLIINGERSAVFNSFGEIAGEAGTMPSAANGDGMISISASDDDVFFSLVEELSYVSGLLSGQRQIASIEGVLTESEAITPEDEDEPSDDETEPGEEITEEFPAATPTMDVMVDGAQTLTDGTVVPYVGVRMIERLDEIVTNPDGEALNIFEDQFERQITLDDGSIVTETNIERTYLSFDESSRQGLIRGYQEGGVDRFIVDPLEGVPGFIQPSVGSTRNYTATYDDGTTETLDQVVTGTAELIAMGAARLTFISTIHVERVNPTGRRQIVDMTVWFHRTLGVLQRHVSGSVTEPDGAVRTIVFDEVLVP